MDIMNALDTTSLRKALGKVRKTKIAAGTVVRWKSSIYTYVAVYAGGKWWISGTGAWYGGNVFETEEFFEILRKAESVEIAVSWESVD